MNVFHDETANSDQQSLKSDIKSNNRTFSVLSKNINTNIPIQQQSYKYIKNSIQFPIVPESLQNKAKQLQRIVCNNPKQTSTWWTLIHFYSAKCKLDALKMLDICEKACSYIVEDKNDRGYAKLHLAQCKYLCQCHRYKSALKLYKAMDINGIGRDLHYFWIGYAVTLVKYNKKQTAIQLLTKALTKISSVADKNKVQVYLNDLISTNSVVSNDKKLNVSSNIKDIPQTPQNIQVNTVSKHLNELTPSQSYEHQVSTPSCLIETGKQKNYQTITNTNQKEYKELSKEISIQSNSSPALPMYVDCSPIINQNNNIKDDKIEENKEKDDNNDIIYTEKSNSISITEPIYDDNDSHIDNIQQSHHFNDLIVNGKRYCKISIMGKGGSAQVLKVMGWIGNDNKKRIELFAIKQVRLSDDEEQNNAFKNEINYLLNLRGQKNIVHLYDYEMSKKRLSLVLELGDIDLRTLLKQLQKQNIRINTIKVYWQQMLEAVSIIHDKRIIHADLKPANFVSFKGCLKLIDFGIAGAIQANTTSIKRDSMIGTLNYISPEALCYQDNNTIKLGVASDIWSLGIILYEMIYNTTPFACLKNIPQKVQCILSDSYEIKYPPINIDTLVIDVIKLCLQRDPKQRPTTKQLLEHSFLY